ncbi:MAG: hypothetical protein WCH11_08170, partial [Bdellovibrio sp.]
EEYRYMFVINDYGQLKISPFAEKSFPFRPPLMRLSHARRIYAGGTFFISSSGRLHLTLDSRILAPFGRGSELREPFTQREVRYEEGLEEFIRQVFHKQSDRQISLF